MSSVMIMAGGTGGHIYPALAVGTELQARGIKVFWMGVRSGLEDELARNAGFQFDSIRIKGLRGAGMMRWLTLPFWLTVALFQCFGIILERRPDILLGMGGYVCGPGGIAAWILRRPLVIHESNSVAGLTNRVLARVATRVLTGFKATKLGRTSVHVGTPVRADIIKASQLRNPRQFNRDTATKLLVLGGSQGAQVLNETVPLAIAALEDEKRPQVMHQTGRGRGDATVASYQAVGVEVDVAEYIDDMASAYSAADVVIARAGAMTMAELSVMGIAAILVPYPYAAGDHQRMNARTLASEQRALVCLQNDGFTGELRRTVKELFDESELIGKLSERIREIACPNATQLVADNCIELMRN